MFIKLTKSNADQNAVLINISCIAAVDTDETGVGIYLRHDQIRIPVRETFDAVERMIDWCVDNSHIDRSVSLSQIEPLEVILKRG
jgi:hypothetical protein